MSFIKREEKKVISFFFLFSKKNLKRRVCIRPIRLISLTDCRSWSTPSCMVSKQSLIAPACLDRALSGLVESWFMKAEVDRARARDTFKAA
jgi:hypothetical protein